MSFGIDHPLLAVNDLDHAAQVAERLGFTLAPRHRHPWGTDNRLAFFSNNFLELIAIGRPEELDYRDENGFQFGRLIEARLKNVGDGIAMVALDSGSIQRDHALVAARGFDDARPIVFRRMAHVPGRRDEEVSVALDILHDAERPFLTQFLCQQLRPELFHIDPRRAAHANTATSISDVWYLSDDPAYDIAHFRRIHGETAIRGRQGQWTIHTHKGDCHLLDREATMARFPTLGDIEEEPPRAIALTLTCRDLNAAIARWSDAGINYHRHSETVADIAPGWLGTLLRFEQR